MSDVNSPVYLYTKTQSLRKSLHVFPPTNPGVFRAINLDEFYCCQKSSLLDSQPKKLGYSAKTSISSENHQGFDSESFQKR